MAGKREEVNKQYAALFRAFGDVHRLQILKILLEREHNAGELLEKVNVVQSTLSHHMKSLCDSGLVIPRRSGKWTYYRVSVEMVERAREYLLQYMNAAGPVSELKAQEKEITKDIELLEKADVIRESEVKTDGFADEEVGKGTDKETGTDTEIDTETRMEESVDDDSYGQMDAVDDDELTQNNPESYDRPEVQAEEIFWDVPISERNPKSKDIKEKTEKDKSSGEKLSKDKTVKEKVSKDGKNKKDKKKKDGKKKEGKKKH